MNYSTYKDIYEYIMENYDNKQIEHIENRYGDIDSYIHSLPKRELLSMYLEWNGIKGYTDNIYSIFMEK